MVVGGKHGLGSSARFVCVVLGRSRCWLHSSKEGCSLLEMLEGDGKVAWLRQPWKERRNAVSGMGLSFRGPGTYMPVYMYHT